MRNVTLSADDQLLERAREVARSRSTTLNQLFRDWLTDLTRDAAGSSRYDRLMEELQSVRAGRKFSRDEMNER